MKQFILISTQFGYDIFISDNSQEIITDNSDNALVFDENDNIETKESFYSAILGYTFKAKFIN